MARHFDKNGDGVVSKEEYDVGIAAMTAFDPKVFGERGKVKFSELMQVADKNKDGKLQVEELASWLSNI